MFLQHARRMVCIAMMLKNSESLKNTNVSGLGNILLLSDFLLTQKSFYWIFIENNSYRVEDTMHNGLVNPYMH